MIHLNVKTDQEAFDRVCEQLRTQPHRCVTDDDGSDDAPSCRYRFNKRASDKVRCAIGGLIPDNEYRSTIEGRSIVYLINHGTIGIPSTLTVRLLQDLQNTHDHGAHWGRNGFVGWERLCTIGLQNNLDVTLARKEAP